MNSSARLLLPLSFCLSFCLSPTVLAAEPASKADAKHPKTQAGASPTVDAGTKAAPAGSPPATGAVDDAAIGEIWKEKCKSCHGEDGRAQTKMGLKHKIPDFTNAAWQKKESDAELREAISEGEADTKMKAFKNKLSGAEIDGLVRFIRRLK